MKLTFLGTSSMMPTKHKNHSAFFLEYKNQGILFDCGEGTQRQFRIAGIRPTKITKILISHWHGDHVLGLPGLLDTLSASEYQNEIEIFGPEGIKKQVERMNLAFPSLRDIKIKVTEINNKVFENEDFLIESFKLEHGIPVVGYRFEEKERRRINLKKTEKLGIPQGPLLGKLQKGESIKIKNKTITPEEVSYIVGKKVFGYVPDTKICKNIEKIINNADVVISESTYESSMEKEAKKRMHLTAKQISTLAKKCKVKQLFLTHLSTRYANTKKIKDDLVMGKIARDLDVIEF